MVFQAVDTWSCYVEALEMKATQFITATVLEHWTPFAAVKFKINIDASLAFHKTRGLGAIVYDESQLLSLAQQREGTGAMRLRKHVQQDSTFTLVYAEPKTCDLGK